MGTKALDLLPYLSFWHHSDLVITSNYNILAKPMYLTTNLLDGK